MHAHLDVVRVRPRNGDERGVSSHVQLGGGTHKHLQPVGARWRRAQLQAVEAQGIARGCNINCQVGECHLPLRCRYDGGAGEFAA